MEELIEYFNTQGITDPRVQANIIAQIQRESGGIPKTESLNYSPERALEIFPKYFKDLEDAKTVLAQGPEAFAHRIYGNRKNLGNESNDPNEAYKYRGRGLIQLTGRGNYEKYGKLLGIDLVNNPELANDPVIAQKIASSYYLNKGKGKDLSDINVVNKLTGFVDKGGESQKRIDLANKIYKDLEPQKEVVQQGIPTLKPQEEVVTETNPLKQGIGATLKIGG
jgi:predicted chitinase